MPTHQDRDVYDQELDRRRCVADSKQTGDRCRNRPIPGGTVCRFHGAAAPQVTKAARQRLREAVDPALGKLEEMLEIPLEVWVCLDRGTDTRAPIYKPVGISHADALRAIEAVLDRTGYPRRTEIDLGDARSRLLERLRTEAGA